MITNLEEEGIIAVDYIRASTKTEIQKISFEYQREELRKNISDHKNWRNAGEYFDKGVTGTLAKKRSGFLKMIEDAKHGKFNLIVIRDVSRFARYLKEFLIYIEELKEYGVAVYFVQNNLLSSIPDNFITLSLMATLAESESLTKSDYTNIAHKARRDKKFIFGSNNRFGYNLVKTDKGKPNKLEENKEEADIIRDIYEMYLDGKGCRLIAQTLNAKGYNTKTESNIWYTSTVHDILTNKCLCGYIAYNKSRKEGLHKERCKNRNKLEHIFIKSDDVPTIIDEETFDKVQRLLHSRTKKSKNPSLDKNGNPLKDENGNVITKSVGYKPVSEIYSKKLQCSCGCTFKGSQMRRPNENGIRPFGYRCYNSETEVTRLNDDNMRKKVCNTPAIDKVKLDMSALKIFDTIWGDKSEAARIAYEMIIDCYKTEKARIKKKKPEDLEKEIKKIEKKKSDTMNMFLEDKVSNETLQDITKIADEKIKVLTDELNVLQQEYIEVDSFNAEDEKKKIKNFINKTVELQKNDYGYYEVNKDFIDAFVNKIVVFEDGSFHWYVNLKGSCKSPTQRRNYFDKNYADRYIINENAVPFFEYIIEYTEACSFVKEFRRNGFQRPAWKDIKIKVLLEY